MGESLSTTCVTECSWFCSASLMGYQPAQDWGFCRTAAIFIPASGSSKLLQWLQCTATICHDRPPSITLGGLQFIIIILLVFFASLSLLGGLSWQSLSLLCANRNEICSHIIQICQDKSYYPNAMLFLSLYYVLLIIIIFVTPIGGNTTRTPLKIGISSFWGELMNNYYISVIIVF